MSRNPFGPGRLGPIRSGCSRPWQKSPGGRGEHRLHVVRREGDVADLNVAEVRCVPGDLVDDLFRHLVLEVAVLLAGCFYGERVGVRAGRVLAGWCHGGVVYRGNLHSHRRAVGDDAAPALLPLALLFFGRIEDADGPLHAGLVEELVGRGELGQAVECEVDLHERRPVVAAAQACDEVRWQVLGTDQIDQGVIGREVGNNHRRTDLRAVAQTHTGDAIVLDESFPPWRGT